MAEQGLPFRDAYKAVAAQIQDGTFKPDRSSPATSQVGSPYRLDLGGTTTALGESEAWLQVRREQLQQATERLFEWK